MQRNETSDDDLIAAASTGDEAAFNRLVRRHADRAHALAASFLGSRNDADDVVQDAFYRAWRMLPRWRAGEASFSTWLHRVVVNLCIDRQRRAKLRRWLPFADVEEPASDDVRSDQRLEADQELGAVMEDLQALPDRQRAALLLSADSEKSNAEIGIVLGVSEKAVESLLVRGRRTLRAKLAAREGDGR